MSAALSTSPAADGGQADGEVAIVTAGQTVSGWTDVAIAGGLDMMPATFELGLTEHYPGPTTDLALKPGDACTVTIGGDVVITGWINRVSRQVSAGQHDVRVSGRSRCQDLVDCSALPKNLSLNGATVGDLATTLAQPFAGPIAVQEPDGDGDSRSYAFSISLGETPWEIISQVASYEGLLVHDDARGDLVICRVGTTQAASGFREGVNLQQFGAAAADDGLYSSYIPLLNAQDSLALIGPGGNNAGSVVADPLVVRYRPLVVISDQMVQDQFLAQKRAVWEATRRRGRAQTVRVSCDSWRDSAGTLWTHNVLAPVDIPTVGVSGVQWIIATWSLVRNAERGTAADITLMPPTAFAVAPTALMNESSLIAQASQQAALDGGAPAVAGADPTAPNGQDLAPMGFGGGDYGL